VRNQSVSDHEGVIHGGFNSLRAAVVGRHLRMRLTYPSGFHSVCPFPELGTITGCLKVGRVSKRPEMLSLLKQTLAESKIVLTLQTVEAVPE
jgi:hypothetical protein